MKDKITQLEQAKAHVDVLRSLMKNVFSVTEGLRAVVDVSQNDPPEGASDGSIKQPIWNEFADLCEYIDDAGEVLSMLERDVL